MTIGGNVGHERFLATPLFFFIIFFLYVACLLLRNYRPGIVLKISVGTLLVGFVIGSVLTTKSVIPIWSTNYTLWGWMYQRTPNVDYVSTAYFLALLEERRYEEFEREYEKVLRDKENITPAQMVFYSTYLLDQRNPLATKSIEAAINLVKRKSSERGNNVIGSMEAASGMLYFLYIDKALALAILDGSVNSALDASIEADRWKASDSPPNYEALWHRLAYLYILKDYEGARNLYLEIKNFSVVGGKNLMHSYFDVIYRYCLDQEKIDDNSCQEKAKKSIPSISP